MEPNLKLSKEVGPFLTETEVVAYKRLFGRLLYLQIFRPNITFAVHRLSQFLQKLSEAHLEAVHQLLRYLKRETGKGILLKPVIVFQLRAIVDADWAACVDTRRPVTSFCVFLSDSIISLRYLDHQLKLNIELWQ